MTTKSLSGFRLVSTRRGDTLQRVAARELGDAARWYELAEINSLRPPYLTDDEDDVTSKVKLTGEQLLIPAVAPIATADTNPDSVFGVDVQLLPDGRLDVTEDGDLALVGGSANYVQALGNVARTEPGDLLFHPGYGCGIRSMIGSSNSRSKMVLAGALVRRALEADPRTREVRSALVEAEGDVLRVTAEAIAIHERPVRVSEVL